MKHVLPLTPYSHLMIQNKLNSIIHSMTSYIALNIHVLIYGWMFLSKFDPTAFMCDNMCRHEKIITIILPCKALLKLVHFSCISPTMYFQLWEIPNFFITCRTSTKSENTFQLLNLLPLPSYPHFHSPIAFLLKVFDCLKLSFFTPIIHT